MSTKQKNRPARMNRYETHKTTQAAKFETLRRKTVRSEKYGNSK